MASYGALIRKITTAEINRVQREGGYGRWAYFVDEVAGKAGVVVANDTTFAAYSVADEPDPKLVEFGLEPIHELLLTPDPECLVLGSGENVLQARVFISPAVLIEDDFMDNFDYAPAQEWQHFLQAHGVQTAETPHRAKYVVMAGIVVLVIIFVFIALLG